MGLYVLVSLKVMSGCGSPAAPVEISLTPETAMVFSTQTKQFNVIDSLGDSDVVWSVSGANAGMQSANPDPAGQPTIDSSGGFTAPLVTQNTNFIVTATSRKDHSKTATVQVTVIPSGQIAATGNPQVAQYTLTPPPGTTAYVQFGVDTSYSLKTWSQPAPASGAALSLFVAGMLANTQYHMRAVVRAPDGSECFDTDHTFMTQAIPGAEVPLLTATTTPGASPQPGIELLDLLVFGGATGRPLAAFDLSGNLIWSYPQSGTAADLVQGVHLLPNGHFLLAISPTSSNPLSATPVPAGTIYALREIDLAGNTIREESLDELNASLASAGYTFTAATFHHDVIALPNGHWIALTNTIRPCSGRSDCVPNATILGDGLVDLAPQADGTFLPVWIWNSFDHLDITRSPFGIPDWTHSNAVLYSPDDGNLLLSMRHQSWIIKINYDNGKGIGNIIWRLGYQGDFALLGGNDPTDWFYAQHGPAFTTPNSAGNFSLAVMDNGNNRVFPAGVTCGAQAAPPCQYSSALVLQIDETYRTATIVSHFLPGEFSSFAGNAQGLADGDLEADFNAGVPGGFSDILEVIPGTAPQVVWHMRTSVQFAYRGFRMPSLYPGVQW